MPGTTDAYDRHGAVLVSDLAMSSVMMGTFPMIVMSHVLVSSWNSVTFALRAIRYNHTREESDIKMERREGCERSRASEG
jgi:hypothetical protein